MVYLPLSAKRFGDGIVAVSYDADVATHLEVMKRNGPAVAEIIPKGALDPGLETITGIGYKAPEQLLIGTADNFRWAMDFDGNVVQGLPAKSGQIPEVFRRTRRRGRSKILPITGTPTAEGTTS
jgi:hypothetical protein